MSSRSRTDAHRLSTLLLLAAVVALVLIVAGAVGSTVLELLPGELAPPAVAEAPAP